MGPLVVAGMIATAALVFWPKDKRTQVVQAATKEIGKSDAVKYWSRVMPNAFSYPKEWCGGFALWAIKEADLARDWFWEVGKGFLYKLPTTHEPKPGDVAYFDSYQHQAVVKSVQGNTVTLINGNGTGGAVTLTTIPLNHATAYYSIEPLLKG